MTTTLVETQLHFSTEELGRACRCSVEWVITLVHEGVLQPAGESPQDWRFSGQAFRRARRAARLAHELELNVAGVALALDLLDRIDQLEAQLARPARA
jgi:chaperone modulatory protein CbpM